MFGNWLKTSLLMAAIMALFGVIGTYIGGASGMVMALLFGGAMNLFAYWFSDSMVLKMYNAQEVDETSAPQFYAMVRELAQRAELPMPRVYLIDEAQPNAFATGRNPEHAAVAATTGILRMLSAREIRGVMAHELAHVQHRDILISTISATMAGAISALANFAMFFGGRDEEGRPANPIASLAVAPNALADALIKIDSYARGIPMPTAEAHPATAQMMIMNPLSGGGIANLFSTHPATEQRVARLRELARA